MMVHRWTISYDRALMGWRAIKWRSLFGLWSFAANRQTDSRDSVRGLPRVWLESLRGSLESRLPLEPTNSQPAAPPPCVDALGRATFHSKASSALRTTWRVLEYSKYFPKSQSVVIKIITIALISRIPHKTTPPTRSSPCNWLWYQNM